MSNEPSNPFAPPSTHRTPAAQAPSNQHQGSGTPQWGGEGRPGSSYASGQPAPSPGPSYPSGQQPYGPGSHGPGQGGPGTDSWGRPVQPRDDRRRRGLSAWWIAPLLVLALVAGALGGWVADEVLDPGRPADANLPGPTARDDSMGELTGVAAIAGDVLPSVVSIEVRGAQGQGTGSGFVLREDGYILTNNHVVAAAASGGEVLVLFSDGSEAAAEVVGRTSDYDLAVIKVDRDGLEPLALADSEEVVVGDPVVAIGAPLGLQGTVTTGIVSALNRPVAAGNGNETAFINAIQTDAAINPGNSGGPLVNAAGEVVGINSAIAQPPGNTVASGSIGLGFAIPANQARRTAEELIETGQATYPVIGVLLDGRYSGEGVQVATESQQGQAPVTPDGPADRAGVEPGDVIVAIDGRPVTEADELIVAIRAKAPGDSVTLRVRSDGSERDVRVVLDETSSD